MLCIFVGVKYDPLAFVEGYYEGFSKLFKEISHPEFGFCGENSRSFEEKRV